jgi:hypothetical protein
LFLLVGSQAIAGSYVCWKGGFYITYPDHYRQVDYYTVDAFLKAQGADQKTLDYEAVFADSSSRPFFDGEYFILTVEPREEFGIDQVDSMLASYRYSFMTGVRHAPLATYLAAPSRNVPYYDAEMGVIAITNDVTRDNQILKRGMIVERMYRRGVASFFFYAPDSLFDRHTIAVIDTVIRSFSMENLELVAPKEQVKVADLSRIDTTSKPPSDDALKKRAYIGVPTFTFVLIVIIIAARRRRKRRQLESR